MEFRHTCGAGRCSGWFWTTLPEGFFPRTCSISSSESIINLTASAGEASGRDKRLVEAGNNAGAYPEGPSPQAPAVSRQDPASRADFRTRPGAGGLAEARMGKQPLCCGAVLHAGRPEWGGGMAGENSSQPHTGGWRVDCFRSISALDYEPGQGPQPFFGLEVSLGAWP